MHIHCCFVFHGDKIDEQQPIGQKQLVSQPEHKDFVAPVHNKYRYWFQDIFPGQRSIQESRCPHICLSHDTGLPIEGLMMPHFCS